MRVPRQPAFTLTLSCSSLQPLGTSKSVSLVSHGDDMAYSASRPQSGLRRVLWRCIHFIGRDAVPGVCSFAMPEGGRAQTFHDLDAPRPDDSLLVTLFFAPLYITLLGQI
jgi:hypothetical protein